MSLLAPPFDANADADWENAEVIVNDPPELEQEPEPQASFASLPNSLTNPKTYATLSTGAKNHLYRTHRLSLWKAAALKQTSHPGEDEGTFRSRLAQSLQRTTRSVSRKAARAFRCQSHRFAGADPPHNSRWKRKKRSDAANVADSPFHGSSVLEGSILDESWLRAKMSRAASSMRAAGRVAKERRDVGQAEETAEVLQQRLDDLEAELKTETEEVQAQMSPERLELTEQPLQPKKADIAISKVLLAWVPFELAPDGQLKRA